MVRDCYFEATWQKNWLSLLDKHIIQIEKYGIIKAEVIPLLFYGQIKKYGKKYENSPE